LSRRNISNKLSVEFAPGRIIRWRKRRFVVVDCTGFEAIIAREVGKRRLERIPVAEAQPDHSINQRAISVTNLVAVPEAKWQTAVRQFTVLKRLLEMDGIERTRAAVEKVAKILKKHPATIYRWIESYNCSGRLSELLRKNRADRGKSRLSSKVDTIIEDAIKKIYLTAEQPHISAVIEEVNLQGQSYFLPIYLCRPVRNERPLFQRRENSAKHGYGNILSIPVLMHCCPIFGFH
jgi:putative transposase